MIQMRDLKAKKENRLISDEDFEKQKQEIIGGKTAPIVVIKPLDECNYRNLIDILDEMAICNIGKYAIVDITDFDKELIKSLNT
jgi:hypothetical protein